MPDSIYRPIQLMLFVTFVGAHDIHGTWSIIISAILFLGVTDSYRWFLTYLEKKYD